MKLTDWKRCRGTSLVLVLLCFVLSPRGIIAAQRTWIGGNVDWVDGGAATNWNPNDEPDADDEAIFNSANSVNLGSNNTVNGLNLLGQVDLFTNDFDLVVDGLVQVAGIGTNLQINGAAGSVDADDLTINLNGTVELRGGTLTLDEEVGTSLVDINVGGNLIGNGTISFADTPGVITTVLINDGELTALSRSALIISPPPVGTLQINTSGPSFTRVDLDGASEAGVVNVNRNQTIDLNVGLSDAFNGTMNLFQQSTFNSLNAWTLAGGSIVVNNGFVDNPDLTPDIPAGTSFIQGGTLTQTGGTINVVDTDGTLELDSSFTMLGGSFTNAGTVIFESTTNINTAEGYVPTTFTAETIINGQTSVTDATGNFNWDGPGLASTTINGTGSLALNVNQIDSTDDVFGGTITLNDNGDLSVVITGTSWTMANELHKNNAGTSTVSGDRVVINGAVNANAGTLDLPSVTTSAAATLAVTGTLSLGGASEFAGGSISGTGTLLMEGTSTVSANTTIGVATFDWDGIGTGTSHTINNGVTFIINSTTIDTDGDMDDPINLGGNGAMLIVNGGADWTTTAAVNANNAGAGTATIGGSRRMILSGAGADLNVNGNTTITAPLTFGAASSASIDAGFTLDATNTVTYAGGTLSGLGTYSPGTTNTVTANTTISSSVFDFDGGNWTVESGVELLVNVGDYDTTVTNAFDGTITLNGGRMDVTTGDAEFVMNGILNMNDTVGAITGWDGEPIDIGNDAGALDADLNIGGTGDSDFANSVDFNSDADVNVAAGAALRFLTNSTVAFDTVNGGNTAEFTGAGEIVFNGVVNVNEAVLLNMVGGTVDLDGGDAVGDFINIDAPMTVNAATFRSFGMNNGVGTNTLDVNNSVGTGVLTVNLDSASAEWTLNASGVMNLVNDSIEATLLAGSDVNIEGTLNVTGDVRTTARLDVTGNVNINTAAQPFRLAGGNSDDTNTIAGGTIAGAGLLGAVDGRGLRGFGTINTAIDFDGSASLFADNGILAINGAILDTGPVGTADDDATFHVTSAWNNNVTSGVSLRGGILSGGAITNDAPGGINGHALVTARVINNTQLLGLVGGTLIFQTAGNDNDWDGTTNTGEIEAVGADIELRDVGAAAGFTGTVRAISGHRVFANGFALDFNPGSTLILEGGKYESTSSTDLGGTVTINAGAQSTIKVENNFFLTFETGSDTTLNANLRLENNNINIEQGATFSGPGALVIPDGSHVVGDNQADIDVLLDMQGAFRPGNSEGTGRVDLFDYQQADTGELFVELRGTALNAFDRLVAAGDVVLDGYLNIDIDEVSPGVQFVPSLGNTFNIITGNTVTGQFDFTDISGMPDGLTFHVSYLANAVQLQVVSTPLFSADFDDDGDVDATDLAIWRGAFDLNQLGDADGDNDSDGEDFLLWQQQFGSLPGAGAALGAAVPEPTSALLLVMGLAGALTFGSNRCRSRYVTVRESGKCNSGALTAIACVMLLFAHSKASYAQTIDISLNLQYTMPSEPAMGGNWTLVAKTSSVNGIGSINAILSNVNAAGIAYQSGIGAMSDMGSPFVTSNGTLVEVLYAQELSNPASVVTDVGRGAGTPGNLAIDPLGDPNWNNAAVIATGMFGDTRPAFTTNLDTPPDVTKGNVLTTKTPPFFMAAAATVTTIVRDGLSGPLAGDYNLNGTVDAADYVVWRETLTQMVAPSSGADGNGNGTIDDADYGIWRANFGNPAGSGAALNAIAAVPEPATVMMLILAGFCYCLPQRRAR